MSDPLLEIQAEIFRRLSLDTRLVAETGEPLEVGASRPRVGLYDYVPEAASAPYVTIGESSWADDSDKTQGGQEVTVTIHHWSEYRGSAELKKMMLRTHELLHQQEFSTDRHQVISITCATSATIKDPDGITQHGIQKFRMLVTDAAAA